MKIKSALNSTGKLLLGLKKSLVFTIFCRTYINALNGDSNHYQYIEKITLKKPELVKLNLKTCEFISDNEECSGSWVKCLT